MQHIKSIILHFDKDENERQIEINSIDAAKIMNVSQVFRVEKPSKDEAPIFLQHLMSADGSIIFSDAEAHDQIFDSGFNGLELVRIDIVTEEETFSVLIPEEALLSLKFVHARETSLLTYRSR